MTKADLQDSEPVRVYSRFRQVFGNAAERSPDARKRAERKPGATVPFGGGRDPEGLSSVIDGLTGQMGWTSSLAKSDLLASWALLAGDETAAHSVPAGIEEGVLIVKCDSTAWATQLRMMRADITTKIAQRFPDAGILSVRFEGPGVPSWKRGPRVIPGRGPRDTYG
ncbi:MAG TPA: DciA family protein [Marisediminicola sp.]|nr:DciA family protein [Marisediminicola sp.]